MIGGDVYILFAVGGETGGPQCHMMKLKKGGNILNPEDWEDPVRVKKMDGSYLTEEGITLDMTHFEVNGISYLVWSYRKGFGAHNMIQDQCYILLQLILKIHTFLLANRCYYQGHYLDGKIQKEL